jgi:membrane-bound lytic murein transglycosylase D
MSTLLINICALCAFALVLSSCRITDNGDYLHEQYPEEKVITPQIPTQQYKHSKIDLSKCAWYYLRNNFELSSSDDKKEVIEHTEWITKNPTYIKQLVERASPYIHYILNQIKNKEFPAEIALLPMIESDFDPFAHSYAGAAGLWQMMPGTATGFGVEQNWWYDGRRDLIDSTKAAIEYLSYLYKFFKGDWLLAIAAYNSGEGTIKKAIRENTAKGLNVDFWSLKLPQQTRKYVPRLLALVSVIKNPEKYQMKLPEFNNTPYFKVITINSQIDLNVAANLAGVGINEIYRLNPGYNRWLTTPNSKNKILLPIQHAEQFQNNFDKIDKSKNISTRYKVKSGDSLISLSKKFNTPVKIIKDLNQLPSNLIKINQELIVPTNHHYNIKQVKNNGSNFPDRTFKNSPIKKIVYRVKPKDSFVKISKKFKVSIAAIEFWNKISHHKPLKPNQKIIIWRKTAKKVHVIKNGETLSGIAEKYNTSSKHIIKINNLKSAHLIKSGQKLIIQV